MTTLFISDTHLETAKPELTEIFLNFLASREAEVDSLYLLGDIFEVWIGDDDTQPLVERVAKALTALKAKGTKVYFLHGNRDFLLGSAYASKAGFALLEDPTIHEIGGVTTILGHGDRYCTDDEAYQSFRKKSRDPQWQKKILGLPLFVRRMIAWYGRQKSKASHAKNMAAGMISDVVEGEVIAEFERFHATRMIHGHTHRPAVHEYLTSSGPVERIVLSDWREFGEALKVDDGGGVTRLKLDAFGIRETELIYPPRRPLTA